MPARSISRRDVLALLGAAPVVCVVWGRDEFQKLKFIPTPPSHPPSQAPAPGPAGRLIAASSNTAYLLEGGSVLTWGYSTPSGGTLGLGHNDRVPPYAAFPVVGLSDAVEIAAGGSCTYARRADGSVVAWGVNARGGLGNTPLAEFEANARARPAAYTPVPVLGLTDVVGIAANGDHALAVTKGGVVHAWGYNIDNQLGIGEWPIIRYKTRSAQPTNYLPYPVRVPGLADVAAVAAGGQHSLALLKDGTVRGWGLNRWGQVGDGTVVNRNTPVAVTGVRNAVAVAANARISAALLADGTVMVWGFGNAGLGRKAYTPDGPHPTPELVPGVTGIRAIALGDHHVLAITTAGTLVSWGDTLVGEVGHGSSLPAPVAGLSNVRAVAAGIARSFAVLANGTIMTWGDVPLWASVEGRSGRTIGAPIPLVIKGLKNPWPSETYTVGK